jgi:hypothetical protein
MHNVNAGCTIKVQRVIKENPAATAGLKSKIYKRPIGRFFYCGFTTWFTT